MEARGFFASLFDYSFSSYITPRIIRILYVLATIIVAFWTLVFILIAFRRSTGFGIVALLIFGPIYFVLTMIWARVGLEVLSAFFRIHGNVQEINLRGGGGTGAVAVASGPTPTPIEPAAEPAVAAPIAESTSAPEPAAPAPSARFCENCGAERSEGQRFCRACGEPLA